MNSGVDIALSDAAFDYIRAVIYKQSAIVLENDKAYLVAARLKGLLQSERIESIEDLIVRLRESAADELRQRVVEALTIHETSFFRDLHPFEALRTQIIPRFKVARGSSRTLNIWCGACSTGQEPYTVAMTILEHFPELASWNIRILATDISNSILSRARAGRFTQLEVNRGLPAKLLVKYFRKDRENWFIADRVRSMVEFRRLNLVEPFQAMSRFDVVFLRNVLIYFDFDHKRKVLEKVRQQLAPDGVLFLGGAESTVNIDPAFESLPIQRCSCYRLKG